MLHGDFIKHRLPDDYFDVVIGNPPFSQTQVLADPRYQKHGFTLRTTSLPSRWTSCAQAACWHS